MRGVYFGNSGSDLSSATNRFLTVSWSRICRARTSTESTNFSGKNRYLRVELMGIEPTASRVRFRRDLRETTGKAARKRQQAFPASQERRVHSDVETERDSARFSLSRAEVRS
jgi:hypothetical protein